MENKKNKREVFTLAIKNYKRYLNDFIRYTDKFRVLHDGSTILIEYQDKSWRFIDYGGVSGRGFHLSKFVRQDVKDFVKKNPNSKYLKKINDNIDLEIQKANKVALKKYLGKQIYCVDVNDCYWETAHILGFISKSTYQRGLKDKKWKTGRNASLGSLSKVIVASDYVNGIRQEPIIIEDENDLSPIRDSVVRKVHGIFMELLGKLKDDWIMYFTDCVYVPFEKIKEVEDFFDKNGYSVKVSTYQLDKFDESGNVCWHDYQKNKAKIFSFNQRQFSLEPLPKFMFEIQKSQLKPNNKFLEK